jgi:hypothetical protein
MNCKYVVWYDVTRAGYSGGQTTVAIGPDASGQPYTDFEDVRKIIALKRTLRPEEIFIRTVVLVTDEQL